MEENKIVMVYETDLWQSRSSYRLVVSFFGSIETALELALKRDNDLVENFKNQDCKIVVAIVENGDLAEDSEDIVFDDSDELKEYLSYVDMERDGIEWLFQDEEENEGEELDEQFNSQPFEVVERITGIQLFGLDKNGTEEALQEAHRIWDAMSLEEKRDAAENFDSRFLP